MPKPPLFPTPRQQQAAIAVVMVVLLVISLGLSELYVRTTGSSYFFHELSGPWVDRSDVRFQLPEAWSSAPVAPRRGMRIIERYHDPMRPGHELSIGILPAIERRSPLEALEHAVGAWKMASGIVDLRQYDSVQLLHTGPRTTMLYSANGRSPTGHELVGVVAVITEDGRRYHVIESMERADDQSLAQRAVTIMALEGVVKLISRSFQDKVRRDVRTQDLPLAGLGSPDDDLDAILAAMTPAGMSLRVDEEEGPSPALQYLADPGDAGLMVFRIRGTTTIPDGDDEQLAVDTLLGKYARKVANMPIEPTLPATESGYVRHTVAFPQPRSAIREATPRRELSYVRTAEGWAFLIEAIFTQADAATASRRRDRIIEHVSRALALRGHGGEAAWTDSLRRGDLVATIQRQRLRAMLPRGEQHYLLEQDGRVVGYLSTTVEDDPHHDILPTYITTRLAYRPSSLGVTTATQLSDDAERYIQRTVHSIIGEAEQESGRDQFMVTLEQGRLRVLHQRQRGAVEVWSERARPALLPPMGDWLWSAAALDRLTESPALLWIPTATTEPALMLMQAVQLSTADGVAGDRESTHAVLQRPIMGMDASVVFVGPDGWPTSARYFEDSHTRYLPMILDVRRTTASTMQRIRTSRGTERGTPDEPTPTPPGGP